MMYPVIFVAALTGAALAIPHGNHSAQPIVNGSFSHVPKNITRRQAFDLNKPCAVQPAGTGPSVIPNTPGNFLAFPEFVNIFDISDLVFGGYSLDYANSTAAALNNDHYLGYMTLTSYNISRCAEICDVLDNCIAFNVYYERDPSRNPDANGCPNPLSVTNIKCSWWSQRLTSIAANNTGETRAEFQVVIAGSSAFSKHFPDGDIPGFRVPIALGGSSSDFNRGYLQSSQFTASQYSPSLCAESCRVITAINKLNSVDGSYQACNYFNSYTIPDASSDSVETYCYVFSEVQDPDTAVSLGFESLGYALNPQDPGHQALSTETPPDEPSVEGYLAPVTLTGYFADPNDANYVERSFTAGSYNPNACADACASFNQDHQRDHEDYVPCNYFNSWAVGPDWTARYPSTVCDLYSVVKDPNDATSSGDHSVGYARDPQL